MRGLRAQVRGVDVLGRPVLAQSSAQAARRGVTRRRSGGDGSVAGWPYARQVAVPANRDHYEVLGVDRDASAATIRKAYLRHARDHHPDQNVGGPEANRVDHDRLIREVNAAYGVLGDRAARRRYDETLQMLEDTRRNGWTSGSDAERARRQRVVDDAAAKAAWRPFDDGPVAPDPRLADEPRTPTLSGGPPLTPLAVTRRVVGGLAVLLVLGGLFTNVAKLAGAGVVLVVIFIGLLLVAPLLALGRSVSNDRR